MSTISIQETQIRIAPAFYNGDFRLFDNTSALYSVGNVFARPDDIFEGSALTSTVSKFDFSNLLGYRLLVDFDLEVPYDASGTWFSLFNKTSGSYNRTVFSDGIASATGSGTTIQFAGTPLVDDWLNGTIVKGLTGGDVLITDYVGATRTATLESSRSWVNPTLVTFELQRNIKTLLAVATVR